MEKKIYTSDALDILSVGFFDADIVLPLHTKPKQIHQAQADWITNLKIDVPGIDQKAYFSRGNSFNEEQKAGKNLFIGSKGDNGTNSIFFVRRGQGSSGESLFEGGYSKLKEFCQKLIDSKD